MISFSFTIVHFCMGVIRKNNLLGLLSTLIFGSVLRDYVIFYGDCLCCWQNLSRCSCICTRLFSTVIQRSIPMLIYICSFTISYRIHISCIVCLDSTPCRSSLGNPSSYTNDGSAVNIMPRFENTCDLVRNRFYHMLRCSLGM